MSSPYEAQFVSWFRSAAPYFHSFRGKTFVVAFGGELVRDRKLTALAHDVNLLHAAGIRLVLVHGARPQIESQLKLRKTKPRYQGGLRITDAVALECVKQAVGVLRVEIEALLSQGLPNSPMAGAAIRTASGNFITARPIGVVDGVDFHYTGTVRKVDAPAIQRLLELGNIVLLSPLGYSPTGETFNLAMEDVATSTAAALGAEKLIFLADGPLLERNGKVRRELTAQEAEAALAASASPSEESRRYLRAAVAASRAGVSRVHLLGREQDGALLLELFTHEGVGSMVTADKLERLRAAGTDDLGGILQLIEPLEADGTLVRRGRELLEREIDRFFVIEHDRVIVGCAALYPFPAGRAAELACLAVHPDYHRHGYGEKLLEHVEAHARKRRLKRLFVLTTRAAHWFIERGFSETGVASLPEPRRSLYNLQRRSKVLAKSL